MDPENKAADQKTAVKQMFWFKDATSTEAFGKILAMHSKCLGFRESIWLEQNLAGTDWCLSASCTPRFDHVDLFRFVKISFDSKSLPG